MIDYVQRIIAAQYDAALCMLRQCLEACPPEHWEGKVASGKFRWVAYHTLFFTDYYLSPSEQEFALRDVHQRGGDERGSEACPGLDQHDALAYLATCRAKMQQVLAGETRESLEGPSGFVYRRFSRGELHLYNIRHIQHHTGQLSAYLRRVDEHCRDPRSLPWVGSGWR
jgi:hypothetical protein